MTFATYTPRVAVHPDRYGVVKTIPNRLMVVHTSEGSEGATSARGLANYLMAPGDRPSPSRPGEFYGASYHYITDTALLAMPCVPDAVVAYSAGGANHDGIHICIPGKAAQTRNQWLDATSRSYIATLAAVIVDVSKRHEIPLARLTVPQVASGWQGYCSHADVSQAFHQSDHTDPGPRFPWDVLASDIDSHVALPPIPQPDPVPDPLPPNGDDMQRISTALDANGTIWVGDGITRRALTDMAQFSNYVVLSAMGCYQFVNTSGKTVTQLGHVQTVGPATIDAMGEHRTV